MTVKELREKTGVGLMLCKQAIDYAKGNEATAIAYIRAKTLAVATPKLTFDERVELFKKEIM